MKLIPLPLILFLLSDVAAQPATKLDDLTAAIVRQHPELGFYEAEIDAARAGRRAITARPDPELSLSAGQKRVRDPRGTLAGEGTTWTVSLTQTFEWPGRLALRRAIANQDVALAELGLARFRSALEGRVRALAIALDSARQRAGVQREVADRFAALKEVFLARDPAGITPLLEARVIEARELSLQRRATEAEIAAQAALIELNQLRGVAPGESLNLAPLRFAFSAPPEADALVAAAREHHFEFRAKVIELEQQGFAVQLARHERQPSFSVTPFISRETAGDRETTIGAGLSIPLPLTNRTRGAAQAAEARHRQAEAAIERARRDLEREVRTAAQALAARITEARRWAPDAVERLREAATLADRHYRLGAVPLGTYVELQTAYLEAVEALLDSRREAIEAAAQLQVLTGRELVTMEAAP